MSQMPGVYDMTLYRGDSYAWLFVLWENAAKTQPVDLSDAVAKAEIRDKPAGTNITPLDCTIEAGTNKIDAQLSAADCHGLPKAGTWDLQITFGTVGVRTVLAGKVTIINDVTDSS
jgi:hypothetical protein